MALRLVRQTSETPNITNKDDTIMTRYAYGGYNGIVKGFGNECGYTADNGIFKVLDGRIVIDGWEIDIDGAGWSLNLSTVTGTQYHSVYAEINVSTEIVRLNSTFLIGFYPEVTKGDDLTQTPNGTARLLLYNVKVENGVITEVVKRFEVIPYLEQIAKSLFDKNNAVAVQRARNFDKNKDENGEYGELYLRFAQIGISNYQGTKAIAPLNGYNKDEGTIEERLTKLGFKEGSVTGVSGATLTKQGRYAILTIPESAFYYTANEQKTTTLTMSFTSASKIVSYIIFQETTSNAYIGSPYEITIEGNKITFTTPDMGNLGAPIIFNRKFTIGFEISSW